MRNITCFQSQISLLGEARARFEESIGELKTCVEEGILVFFLLNGEGFPTLLLTTFRRTYKELVKVASLELRGSALVAIKQLRNSVAAASAGEEKTIATPSRQFKK